MRTGEQRVGTCIMSHKDVERVQASVSQRDGWVHIVVSGFGIWLSPAEARAFRRGLSTAIRKAEEPQS